MKKIHSKIIGFDNEIRDKMDNVFKETKGEETMAVYYAMKGILYTLLEDLQREFNQDDEDSEDEGEGEEVLQIPEMKAQKIEVQNVKDFDLMYR